MSGPVPDGIDRYVPSRNGRSRSPFPRRREGRPAGARRERESRESVGRGGGRPGARPKKTQEELDAEMEDYWGNGGAATETAGIVEPASIEGDIEMVE